MSDQQLKLKDIIKSPHIFAYGAFILIIIGLVLPVLMIRVVNPLLGPQNGYVLGYAAFGWVSILLVCSFAGSIAARLKSEWLPYRNLVDYVAIAVTLFAILWALFLGPVAGELNQARESANFFRMDASSESPFSVYPHVGMLSVVLAAATLGLARWRGV